VASKASDGETTRSQLEGLDKKQRVGEIARMLGGAKITENTLAHAAEMLLNGIDADVENRE